MLISNYINNQFRANLNPSKQRVNSQPPTFKGALVYDIFQTTNTEKCREIEQILNKFNEFSIDEYNSLSEKELETLRTEYKEITKLEKPYFESKEIEEKHDIAANYIKNTLDKSYGEDNYTVITIGRSLSSIGKTLGYKIGEENVINIPLSHTGRFNNPKFIDLFTNKKPTDQFVEFLEEHNLTKAQRTDKNRKYVIIDYCYSGESLRGAHKLLTEDKFMGKKNVVALDLEKCMPKEVYDTEFKSDLRSCRYKSLSFVHKCFDLDIKNKEVNTRYADTLTRLRWFKLLDNQMTGGYKANKENPQTEIVSIKKKPQNQGWLRSILSFI